MGHSHPSLNPSPNSLESVHAKGHSLVPARSAASRRRHGRPRSPQLPLKRSVAHPSSCPAQHSAEDSQFADVQNSLRNVPTRARGGQAASRCLGRSILVVEVRSTVPLRAPAAVVHQRCSETKCRVLRGMPVAAHRCARTMPSRGCFGYAGPLVYRAAAAVSLRLCSNLGVGPGPRYAGGAETHAWFGGGSGAPQQETRTRMIITQHSHLYTPIVHRDAGRPA